MLIIIMLAELLLLIVIIFLFTVWQLWMGNMLSYRPMSSAGLFGRLLMNVSKASFMALTNFSFFMKHTSMIRSTLSLKSSNSCTMVLSFSGLITIVLPKAWICIFKTLKTIKRVNWFCLLFSLSFKSCHTFMYSIQCCRSTLTPPRTRLKSW